MGSGCGTVGRAVGSDTRGNRFETISQYFYKKKKYRKRGQEWPFKNIAYNTV